MIKLRALLPAAALGDEAATESFARRMGVDTARTESYRTGYLRLIKLCYALTAVIFLLTAALFYTLFAYLPEDGYFAQTSEGATSGLIGLERPPIPQQTLFNWAADSAAQIMTFGFNDYDEKLSSARERFTPEGWLSFAQVMNESRFFQNVRDQQQLLTAVPQGMTTLIFEGLMNGRYTWIVELPLMVTVRSGSLSRSLNQKVRLTIIPVETSENPMGIAIDRWISF